MLFHMKNEDARTVNLISSRLKLLNLPQKYTEYNAITDNIAELIKSISAIDATDDQFMEVTVYVEKGQTIQTNIKIKDGSIIKIIFKKEENKIYILQESPNQELAKSDNMILKYIGNLKGITLSNELGDDNNSSTIKFEA